MHQDYNWRRRKVAAVLATPAAMSRFLAIDEEADDAMPMMPRR
jgi:hypothetical protein